MQSKRKRFMPCGSDRKTRNGRNRKRRVKVGGRSTKKVKKVGGRSTKKVKKNRGENKRNISRPKSNKQIGTDCDT